jgi:tetratricopeptide (TPR) repeat protein
MQAASNVKAIACLVAAWSLAGCDQSVTTTTAVTGGVTPAQLGTPTVHDRLAQAEAAERAGEYEVALAVFRQILARNPTIATAYIGIGEIYMIQQDYEAAEPVLARAARLEPRNFDAQFGHGRALQMLDRFIEAVQAYHRALTIRPDSLEANQHIATTYIQMGEQSSALVFAEKAVDIDPASGPARVNLAAIYQDSGRTEDAIHQYEAAVELMEPTAPLLLSLITALAHEKRYVDAKNTAEYLVKLDPSARAWERLGWCAFRLGDYQQSIESYRESVQVDPFYWPALNGIGCNALNTWLLSGKADGAAFLEARQALRRSLRANPDQPKVVSLLSQYGSG